MYVAQQMGHADWSMLVKVYADWIPSSSALPAGSLVSNVHQANWGNLFRILEASPTEENLNDDLDNDDKSEEDHSEEAFDDYC